MDVERTIKKCQKKYTSTKSAFNKDKKLYQKNHNLITTNATHTEVISTKQNKELQTPQGDPNKETDTMSKNGLNPIHPSRQKYLLRSSTSQD